MQQIRQRLSNPFVRRILGDYAFLAPQLILYVGLTLLPLLIAIPILFTDQLDFNDIDIDYIGFDNFSRIFTDPSIQTDYLPALSRTVQFTLLNYLMVYAFGLTLALLIYEYGFRGGFFTIIYLPMMVSGLAVGYIATMLFSKSTGTVNLLLMQLGWIQEPIDIRLGTGSTVILPIMIGWKYAGFNLAIFLSGLLSIPEETIEAAIVEGASYWQRLTKIYFPQMVPAFIMATIFCLLGSFGVFDEPMAMGAFNTNTSVRFLSIVFYAYGFTQQRLALGMTLAVQTFVPLVVLAYMLQQLQKRLSYQY
jgi:ABC-type sugar transport system permease subunit